MKHGAAVIDRMREAAGLKTDVALAKFLGVPRGTVTSWRRQGSVPQKYVLQFAAKVSVILDWLLTGSGPMQRTGLYLAPFDARLLAIAIDQAHRWASVSTNITGRADYSCAELVWIVHALYGDVEQKFRDFEKAGFDSEAAVKALRVASGLPADIDYVTWWDDERLADPFETVGKMVRPKAGPKGKPPRDG